MLQSTCTAVTMPNDNLWTRRARHGIKDPLSKIWIFMSYEYIYFFITAEKRHCYVLLRVFNIYHTTPVRFGLEVNDCLEKPFVGTPLDNTYCSAVM